MRAPFYALLLLALAACIDTPLSLGRHDAPAGGDGDFVPVDMDAAFMPPLTGGASGASGGTGGAPAMPPADAGPDVDAAIPVVPVSPCEEVVTLNATLACEIGSGGGFGGQPGGRPPPMITTTTLTFSPPRAGQHVARASGPLAFEAWNASWSGRITGGLDCTRGVFNAVIEQGEVSMPGTLVRPFFGRLDGVMDPATGAIAGPFWHGPDPNTPACVGDWAATAP